MTYYSDTCQRLCRKIPKAFMLIGVGCMVGLMMLPNEKLAYVGVLSGGTIFALGFCMEVAVDCVQPSIATRADYIIVP